MKSEAGSWLLYSVRIIVAVNMYTDEHVVVQTLKTRNYTTIWVTTEGQNPLPMPSVTVGHVLFLYYASH